MAEVGFGRWDGGEQRKAATMRASDRRSLHARFSSCQSARYQRRNRSGSLLSGASQSVYRSYLSCRRSVNNSRHGYVVGKLIDVDVLDPRPKKVETRFDAAVNDIGRIGVPADADALVPRGLHDGGGDGRILCLRAVHFHPDLDAAAGAIVAKFPEALADSSDRRILGHVLRADRSDGL